MIPDDSYFWTGLWKHIAAHSLTVKTVESWPLEGPLPGKSWITATLVPLPKWRTVRSGLTDWQLPLSGYLNDGRSGLPEWRPVPLWNLNIPYIAFNKVYRCRLYLEVEWQLYPGLSKGLAERDLSQRRRPKTQNMSDAENAETGLKTSSEQAIIWAMLFSNSEGSQLTVSHDFWQFHSTCTT